MDPDLCFRVFLRIWIQETKMLQIQRIQILSTTTKNGFLTLVYTYNIFVASGRKSGGKSVFMNPGLRF